MNSNPSFPGLKQGGSDQRELMLPVFGGEVLAAFAATVLMRDKHMVQSLSKGKEFRFPAVWRTSASYHTPGQEITGNQIAHNEIVVTPDQKLITNVFVSDLDEILMHYQFRSQYATELGTALAEFYDANVIRRVVQSARGPALFTGDQGGSTLTTAGLDTDATKLFDSVSAAKETMETKRVPVNSQPLHALFKPAQWYIMARSDRNLNRDKNGGAASDRKHSLETIDEVLIHKSVLAPFGVNDSGNAELPAKYRADFRNTVGVVWTPHAVATAEVQAPATQVVDQPHKQGTLLIGRLTTGTDPLRTKCAVELAKPAA